MALTPYSQSTSVIGALGTDPEDRPDLDDQGLKDKFDENAANIVEYINGTLKTAVDGKSNKIATFKAITASKTFDLTDADDDVINICTHASVAINLTIPPNSSVAYPIGSVVCAKYDGAAQVAFVAGSGVTINPSSKLKINAQNDYVSAIKRATDTWDLIGPTKA